LLVGGAAGAELRDGLAVLGLAGELADPVGLDYWIWPGRPGGYWDHP
jgi:hypothetical protein